MPESACALYDCLMGMEPVLLRHNENKTYRVGTQYLLRIHRHRDGFTSAFLTDGVPPVAIREAELAFLVHLAANGIPVQTPVPNHMGRLVSQTEDGTPVTVLTWIPGRTVEQADITPRFCSSLGHLVGRMHVAAATYQGPAPVRYDAALADRLLAWLTALPNSKALPDDCRASMLNALMTIRAYLVQTEAIFLPVHSDFSTSNLLVTDAGLVPIDFSLFGMGAPMLDVGGLFANVATNKKQRIAFAAGYAAASGHTLDLPGVDAMFALQILLGIALHYPLWEKEAWFARRLPAWCAETFTPLASMQRVLVF